LPIPEQYKNYLLDSSVWGKNPQFYSEYPDLFRVYFNDVEQETVNRLSIAGFLYYQSTLLTDALIDEKDLSKFPVISICQEEAVKILTSIFGIQSVFWEKWNNRRNEYFKAVAIEKQLYQKENVDSVEYEMLADYKSAFGKVAIDCLRVLTKYQDEHSTYNTLLLSHKYFSIGFQLYDDVKDFKEDVINKQFNWAVYQFKSKFREDFEQVDITTSQKLLFIRGVAQDLLKKAIEYFDLAKSAVAEQDVPSKWLETIEKTKKEIENYVDITEGYLLTLIKRLELENITSQNFFLDLSAPIDESIKNGLVFIHNDYLRNFAELKHVMYLSGKEGFENSDKIHVGDIFQRSMLADCLLAVAKKCNLEFLTYIETEIKYLIENRLTDSIGAWSYFPTVKEIAADIDDLGQIIQLFAQVERNDLIDTYCKTAVTLAIKDRRCPDGGIETWILPKVNLSPSQAKQAFFNQTKWGTGPDTEAVANLWLN
jgi:hypothetical protein